MPSKPFFVVNAFAEKPFGGNPAGVFPDASGLSDSEMQAIAKQLNLVETVFVFPKPENGADFQLRYFTPVKELPIAGHPTIATWVALAKAGIIDVKDSATFRQLTQKGIQEIRVENTPSGFTVWMQQLPPKFLAVATERISAAFVFGISPDDMIPELPIAAVDTGLGHIIFGVKSLEALMRVRRNIAPLKELCDIFKVSEAQIFCKETYDPSLNYHTRNICPREGIEDPACGVGNSALLAYLMKEGVEQGPAAEIKVEQGQIENMPSVISVRGKQIDDTVELSIGGSGVVMVNGTFSL